MTGFFDALSIYPRLLSVSIVPKAFGVLRPMLVRVILTRARFLVWASELELNPNPSFFGSVFAFSGGSFRSFGFYLNCQNFWQEKKAAAAEPFLDWISEQMDVVGLQIRQWGISGLSWGFLWLKYYLPWGHSTWRSNDNQRIWLLLLSTAIGQSQRNYLSCCSCSCCCSPFSSFPLLSEI